MRQELSTDTVDRYIDASPQVLYDLIADVTRTPELTPDIVKVEWLDGATEAVVGARFKAVNTVGRGRNWSNKPVITAVEPGREIAWQRTEPFAGTIEWRYRFEPEGSGTRVVESYEVIEPVTGVGWFVIDTVFRAKDRRGALRRGMVTTLDRLAELTEGVNESAAS